MTGSVHDPDLVPVSLDEVAGRYLDGTLDTMAQDAMADGDEGRSATLVTIRRAFWQQESKQTRVYALPPVEWDMVLSALREDVDSLREVGDSHDDLDDPDEASEIERDIAIITSAMSS